MIRNLIGFVAFMILAIAGGNIGEVPGILGFILGVGAWFAIATGRADFLVRELKDLSWRD